MSFSVSLFHKLSRDYRCNNTLTRLLPGQRHVINSQFQLANGHSRHLATMNPSGAPKCGMRTHRSVKTASTWMFGHLQKQSEYLIKKSFTSWLFYLKKSDCNGLVFRRRVLLWKVKYKTIMCLENSPSARRWFFTMAKDWLWQPKLLLLTSTIGSAPLVWVESFFFESLFPDRLSIFGWWRCSRQHGHVGPGIILYFAYLRYNPLKQLALRWIQDNIGAFGGNPRSVHKKGGVSYQFTLFRWQSSVKVRVHQALSHIW